MPARIGEATEDTLQTVAEKLEELIGENPNPVTALPEPDAPGTPVYVIAGEIVVTNPVKLLDLRINDPIEAEAPGLPVRLVPEGVFYSQLNALARTIGPNTLDSAITTRFAIDALPNKNPNGAPAADVAAVINDGPTLLFTILASFRGTGAGHYLQLHDAAAATTLSNSTMTGWTFPLDQLNQRWLVSFSALGPLKFVDGCRWAMSTTEHTYTASIQTASVQYIMRAP